MSWLSSFERRGFVYSVASAVSGCGCPFDDAAQAGVCGVAVPPRGGGAGAAVLFVGGGGGGAAGGGTADRGGNGLLCGCLPRSVWAGRGGPRCCARPPPPRASRF